MHVFWIIVSYHYHYFFKCMKCNVCEREASEGSCFGCCSSAFYWLVSGAVQRELISVASPQPTSTHVGHIWEVDKKFCYVNGRKWEWRPVQKHFLKFRFFDSNQLRYSRCKMTHHSMLNTYLMSPVQVWPCWSPTYWPTRRGGRTARSVSSLEARSTGLIMTAERMYCTFFSFRRAPWGRW